MNSKAYSARSVNQVQLAPLLIGREGRPMWVGVDVGKFEMQAVLHRGAGEFERPWRIANPADVRAAVEHFRQLAAGRELVVAMEPSGTYGDALRQACHDAGVVVHRVRPKVAHDYAETFDGVPSQHDGKDAAAIAELSRNGKSAPWPWTIAPEAEQQIEYHVDRLDAQRRLRQTWCGRIEALLARHWPDVLTQLKLTSPTLLNALIEYGGPAALAADAQAAAKLKRWGGTPLGAEAVARIINGAKRTAGVRQQPTDLTRMRDYAKLALAAADEVKAAKKQLLQLSRDHKAIGALGAVVGNATACLLFTRLGDPAKYHCAAAYVKAMGLNLAERSSGTYKGKLKISKRGSSTVRYWMYLAALRLTKTGSPVRPWYLRKKHKDSQKAGRALVAIMRRLGLALYHVAALGEAYDAKRLFPGKHRRPVATAVKTNVQKGT
jgi:transposase